MSTKIQHQNKSLEFATKRTVLSPEDRAKAKRNLPKNICLLALSAVSVFAAYNGLEKVGKVEPSKISEALPATDYNKLSTSGLPVLTNVSVKATESINFRSTCSFEDSSGNPLDNIVFTLNPSSANSANKTLNLAAAIPVNGPSANVDVSQSDVWFVVPTGHGDQSVCFDASEASRGTAYDNVTVNQGESAVGNKPNATAILKDNNIYVNGNLVAPLQMPLAG